MDFKFFLGLKENVGIVSRLQMLINLVRLLPRLIGSRVPKHYLQAGIRVSALFWLVMALVEVWKPPPLVRMTRLVS